MFKLSCTDIDEQTDVISCYVSFCEENVIPKESNSKAWMTKQLKVILNQKCKVFQEGNLSELNLLKKELKREIRIAKLKYKEKLEKDLGYNNLATIGLCLG